MEPVIITSIVLSIIAALGTILSRLRFKHCHMGCIDSDCVTNNTPPTTPTTTHNTSNIEELYVDFSTAL